MENIVQGQWFRGPSADLGDEISQSLRFNGTQALVRTATAAVTGDWTLSFWMKIDGPLGQSPDAYLFMFGAYAQTPFNLYMNNNRAGSLDTIGKIHDVTNNFTLTGRYRDPSAWYHFVMKRASNAVTAWMNGVQVLTYSSGSTMNVNNSELFSIGDGSYSSVTAGFDGYMADWHFVDGQAKDATDFGRYNNDNVWVPKTYTGTYGSQGFHLTFDSSQNANALTGIGIDSSGNNNHFAAKSGSNWGTFETAALSSSNFDNDIDYQDTPTNNFATQNPLIKSPTSLIHYKGNLKNVDSNGSYPNSDPATQILRGKKYWEVELEDTNASYPYVGICKAEDIQNGGNWYSTGGNGAHYYHGAGYNGWVSNPSNTIGNGANGDVIGIAFDRDTLQCTFTRNGGTGQTVTAPAYDGEFCPVILNAVSEIANVNYGQRPFRYTPPAGYTALATNNDSEPAIKDPRKHFEIVTWTGNSVDDRDITGLEFAPDLVWLKQTNAAQNHGLFDTCRGATIRQTTSTNIADDTKDNDLQAFNSDGFQVGNSGRVNSSGQSYKAWCWKAGGAPTATNTAGAGNVPTAGSVKIDGDNLTTALAGTIPANKLSANTTAGFSIVTYTGTGSNATVAHGLTQAPDLVWYKITSSTNGWCSYSFRTAAKYMQTNQPGAETTSSAVFNDTHPTNSVLHVGSSVLTNGNTSSYLAYCWHSVPGFSKIGEHRGNGDADGNFIYTGFKPQFLILKGTTTTQNWVWFDTTGHEHNPVDRYHYVNLTDAENSSSTTGIDFLANGFKIRNSHSMLNQSGIYFLYMAFAENPFGGENTAPATAR